MVAIEYNKDLGRYVTYDLTEQSFVDKHDPSFSHQIAALRDLYQELNASYQACWCGDVDLTHFAMTNFTTYAPDTCLHWNWCDSFFNRLWSGCERSFQLVGYVRLHTTERKPQTVRYLTMDRASMFSLLHRITR